MADHGSIPALAAVLARAGVALSGAVPHCPAGDCLQSPRGGDAVADAVDAAQLLDVDMDHLAGGVLFVTDDLGLGVERGQVAQPTGFSDPGHRGAGQADRGRDPPERLADATQDLDRCPLVIGCAGLHLVRAAGAILQPCLSLGSMAGHPFAHCHRGNPKRAGNLTWRLACLPPLHNQGSHFRRGLGILVNVHGMSPEDRAASQPPQSPVSAREQPIETLHLERVAPPSDSGFPS